MARTFALVREVAGRRLGMRHFDVQLIGGLRHARRHDRRDGDRRGQDAHRDAAGLRPPRWPGIPVHVVTVNDYLAQRDAEWMAPALRVRSG